MPIAQGFPTDAEFWVQFLILDYVLKAAFAVAIVTVLWSMADTAFFFVKRVRARSGKGRAPR
jgi:hypothetical protein